MYARVKTGWPDYGFARTTGSLKPDAVPAGTVCTTLKCSAHDYQ